MFARRLRILLILIVLGATLLAARAAQVQIGQAQHWRELASKQGIEQTLLPPQRGRILDRNGLVMARNSASIDLAVDYRVVPFEPDASWLRAEASRRARDRLRATSDEAEKDEILTQEQKLVLQDLEAMWDFLAGATGRTRAEIDQARQVVVDRVTRRRERTWRLNFEAAKREFDARPAPAWYERWLGSVPDAPTPDDFRKTIAEEVQTHVIVASVPGDQFNAIGLMQKRLPTVRRDGKLQSVIELRQSQKREYPMNEVACHVLGTMSEANAEDVAADPNKDDDARELRAGDWVGRSGVEKLAEPVLRGSRGVMKQNPRGELIGLTDARSGGDVYLTIDSKLQERVERAFRNVQFQNPDEKKTIDTLSMNGAAVVLDVRSNELLAIASVPTYDPNRYRELLASLESDDVNAPLRMRALATALEPGSTVKPIVGMGAIMQNLIAVDGKIECKGYIVINGRQINRPRCWTMSLHGKTHVEIPWDDPLDPPMLNYAEAVKRSCNVYFATLGARLGADGLSYWMRQFGLGERADIGLTPEAKGVLPIDFRGPADERGPNVLLSSIGQGTVAATPIQLANYVATIARDGVRLKPKILKTNIPTTTPSATPERVDLKLSKEALAALKHGMRDVVNSAGGTGTKLKRTHDDLIVAAKTGSATASRLSRTLVDDAGQPLLDEEGRPRIEVLQYGSKTRPNPLAPWYRYTTVLPDGTLRGTHSWVIGFAPADDPRIAFCVMVEYGGSGQTAAGSVANQLIDALIDLNYLRANPIDPNAHQLAPSTQPSELLSDDPTNG